MRNDRGYTYLITNGTHYKIGITTKTPVSRVAELQTGSPTKISISGYSYNSNALAMEIELHKKFASKRLEGEWFELNDNDVAIIHYHFETNYLDEYFAPLSKKALEASRKEKDEYFAPLSKKGLEASQKEKDEYFAPLSKKGLEASRKEKDAYFAQLSKKALEASRKEKDEYLAQLSKKVFEASQKEKEKIVRIEKRNARDIEYREERIKNIELQKGRNERLEENRAEYQAKQRERKAGTVRTKDSWKDYL